MNLFRGVHTQRDLGRVGAAPERSGAVLEHLLRHSLPLRTALAVPTLGLGHGDRHQSPDQFEVTLALDGIGAAAPVICPLFSDPAESHRREAAAAVDGGDQKRGRPSGLAVDGHHGLHHGHYRCADALAQFERDNAVAEVGLAPVGVRNERARRQGLGHALHTDERVLRRECA